MKPNLTDFMSVNAHSFVAGRHRCSNRRHAPCRIDSRLNHLEVGDIHASTVAAGVIHNCAGRHFNAIQGKCHPMGLKCPVPSSANPSITLLVQTGPNDAAAPSTTNLRIELFSRDQVLGNRLRGNQAARSARLRSGCLARRISCQVSRS